MDSHDRLCKKISGSCCRYFIGIFMLAAFLFTANVYGQKNKQATKMERQSGLETATFGSGCFWCTEAIFLDVEGIMSAVSGYMGGKVKNPTYKEVCSGLTGHAEVVQLTFEPGVISYEQLLEIFWQTHDPTTLNQQGADVGTQYRSVVFYHSEEQRKNAEFYKSRLEEEGAFDKPIVTEIDPASIFYKAENYHQNYYNLNSNAPYCTFVIRPKLEKFKKAFKDKLKN
ncbi:MAG: peptide-methionine (S)-S-oxide reductase MsrA [Cyclobacteriaceae bacterium]